MLAKAKHARNEKLVKTGAVSREEYEETLAAVTSVGSRDHRGQGRRESHGRRSEVHGAQAPISGRIDRAFVTKGNLLTGGQLGHAADQNRQRAADVRVLRCR